VGEIKVNKTKQSHQTKARELSDVLDSSLEVARNLKMSETELLQKLAERIRSKAPHGQVQHAIETEPQMYNPLGGP
jgi:hypothetical protein